MTRKKDWQGREITHDENPNDMIWVWECEPSINRDYDFVWIREYQRALGYIRDAFEMYCDGLSPEELKEGEFASGSMKLRKVSLMEYEAVGERDE